MERKSERSNYENHILNVTNNLHKCKYQMVENIFAINYNLIRFKELASEYRFYQ